MKYEARKARQMVDRFKEERRRTRFDKKRQKNARVAFATLNEANLFEPLNREERRLMEKLIRRGRLNQWYAWRLAQVDHHWLIPYLKEFIAAKGA